MKIRDARALPLSGMPADGWTSRFGAEENIHTLIEIISDDGVTGVGSVYSSGAQVVPALELLKPLLIGGSAVDPAATSERLHQQTFWQGRGGSVTHTISGIDIALWDLFGKVCRQPISRLLGGRHRDRIRPYGSLLMREPSEMKDRLHEAMGRGFRAFKIGWGPFGRHDARTDRAIVAAARDAIGPDADLMVDAGGSDAFWQHGFKWALGTARMLADYGVGWFEEPLRPDDLEGYVQLTAQSPVPIAAGEVLCRRQEFRTWIERRAVDYLQPDVTRVGGMSEQHRIAQVADDHAITVIPHGWNTAVGLAADLQLAAAAGSARFVEYLTPAPYIDDLLEEPLAINPDGTLAIPEAPGLGLRWDLDGIARHSHGRTLTPSTL
ncbi:MAG: mandelate racemase/muconate lactonizing enzyme family protein [Planctomycetes bacterium]|nr:mandelate racemase/muconate lactonizing enzyme family protein [Planctomycetota bacterium]